MIHFTTEQMDRAVQFLRTEARPLELRRFETEFLAASPDGVLAELRRFQNEDGGFGNGLEPDFRLPDSSPLATSVAFQILREIEAPPDQPLVREGVQYLVSTFDPQRGFWPSVPPATNQHPHAPWWTYDPEQGRVGAETPANPTAEIVGVLRAYPQGIPDQFIEMVTDSTLRLLEQQPDAMPMHDVYCYLRMLDTLPPGLQEKVLAKLRRAAEAVISRDPAEWTAYGPQPLDLVPGPDAPLADLFGEDLQRNLDYRIEHQNPDGSWSPTWDWGGQYPEAWENSRREWQGVLTLANLRLFKRFDRLARS